MRQNRKSAIGSDADPAKTKHPVHHGNKRQTPHHRNAFQLRENSPGAGFHRPERGDRPSGFQFRVLGQHHPHLPAPLGQKLLGGQSRFRGRTEDTDLRVCTLDLFNVHNEEDFYAQLTQCVLKATASKWEEIIGAIKKFFASLVSKTSLSNDPNQDISVEFDWKEVKQKPDEILNLAEKIAQEKGLRIIVCIDEFQNIADFDDPVFFQKRLRSHWQRHRHVAYCLYGSKRHMMMDVFTNASMPFYKFGDLLFLEKITKADWIPFLKERFRSTGKQIETAAAERIADLADCHPYYVQQLAQQSWFRTQNRCTPQTVAEAHAALVGQLSLLFVNLSDNLTAQQLNLLKAIHSGESSLTSAAVLKKYGINSSASVIRSKQALIEKDILDDQGGKLSFQDPIFAYWLKHEYFKIR